MNRWARPLFFATGAAARVAATAFIAIALFVVLAPPTGARAQSDSNAEFWLHERAMQQREQAPRPEPQSLPQAPRSTTLYQRPTHLIRGAKPVRGFTRSIPAASQKTRAPSAVPASAAPAASGPAPEAAPGTSAPPAPTTARATPAEPAGAQDSPKNSALPTRVFTIAVIGDSLGQFLEQGLAESYAERPDIALLKRARDNTGLVREDYFNWVQAAKDLASSKEHIDMAIMMIGSNDRQPIRDASGVYDPLTSKWRQLYAARADAIAAAFHEKKIPFLWVGAPIMHSPSLSDAMLTFNDIYKDSAEKEGATYLDIWDQFADDSGQYALYGPDVNGDMAKLRSSDGVHFTHAGSRKLAQFVEAEIKRTMDGTKPAIDPAIAGVAPQMAPAEPLTRAALSESSPASSGSRRLLGDLRTLLPAPAAPIQPVIPIERAAGPAVALTTPVVAPDGQLVTRALVKSSPEGASAEETLSEGDPIQSRPGRADDFRWPRD